MAKTGQWRLYRRWTYPQHEFGYTYAWLNPDGVIAYARAVAGAGYIVPLWDNLLGLGRAALVAHGFQPAKHNMTQEELSKGWLIL